jgi:hypothetical protein
MHAKSDETTLPITECFAEMTRIRGVGKGIGKPCSVASSRLLHASPHVFLSHIALLHQAMRLNSLLLLSHLPA